MVPQTGPHFDFHPRAMFRRDDEHIAVNELVAVPPGPWDDCFVNEEPVALTIDGIDLLLESDCRDWVVYDMPAHATCVEPQSAPARRVQPAPEPDRAG